ncbi:MAG: hypothetical protein Q4B69_07175 [Slackia sp.]|nr:hypothetical protein [Slackia sp.]
MPSKTRNGSERGFILPEDKLTLEQRALRVLCRIMLGWSLLSFIVDEATLLVTQTPLFLMLENPGMLFEFVSASMLPALSFIANIAYAFLGFIGARTPSKITPFFAIAFLSAMLGGWDLASKISLGTAGVSYVVEVAFVIATACIAWQVKKTTYPKDWYERKEAAKMRRKEAKKRAKAQRRREAKR